MIREKMEDTHLIQLFPITIFTKTQTKYTLFQIQLPNKSSFTQKSSLFCQGIYPPLPVIQTTQRIQIDNKATLKPIYRYLGIENVKQSSMCQLDESNTVLGIRIGFREMPKEFISNKHFLYFTKHYSPFCQDIPQYISEDDESYLMMDNWTLLESRLTIELPGIGQISTQYTLKDPLQRFIEPVFQKWMTL